MSLYHLDVLHCFEEYVTGGDLIKQIFLAVLSQSVRSIEMELKESDIIEDLDPKHSLRCGVLRETA